MQRTQHNLYRCNILNSIARQVVAAGVSEADLVVTTVLTLPDDQPTKDLTAAVAAMKKHAERGELWRVVNLARWAEQATDAELRGTDPEPLDLEDLTRT
jgi:hypothetical protein